MESNYACHVLPGGMLRRVDGLGIFPRVKRLLLFHGRVRLLCLYRGENRVRRRGRKIGSRRGDVSVRCRYTRLPVQDNKRRSSVRQPQ
jgi:hypothetical protein